MKNLFSLLLLSTLLAACGGREEAAKSDPATSGSDSVAGSGSVPGNSSGGSTTGGPTGSGNSGGTTSGKGMYSAETGIVEMKSSDMGNMMVTTYFKDHGATKATYTTVEMMGQKSGNVVIEKDGYVTTYDLTQKTGQRRKLAPGASGGGLTAAMPDFSQLEKMGADEKAQYKLTGLESRTIAGKEGKGYSMEMSGVKIKAWVWDNLPLRMEMDMGGKSPMVVEATKVETGVAIPEDKFTVPADIKVTDS